VFGGGPAGLIAAEVLARSGVTVELFDQMPSLGRKFLLAGRGGLNITHSEPLEQLLGRYVAGTPLVERAVRAFPPSELRAWCGELGQATFTGSSGRVFPVSFRATPLLRAWLARLGDLGVSVHPRHRWQGWGSVADGRIDGRTALIEHDGSVAERTFDAIVLAFGGASWPRVGSTAGWVESVSSTGVEVAPFVASNSAVLVDWTAGFGQRFAGAPVKNMALTVGHAVVRGDAMITESGLEGGPVYAMGAAIRAEIAAGGSCTLAIDLQPDLSREVLAERLGRRPKDSLATALARLGLQPASIGLLRESTANRLPRDPDQLAGLVKALPLEVRSTASLERAISSAGGISLTEVDSSMMLRRVPGTFVAGEMLDWDAPTGGYLLQACLSTGVAAARGVMQSLARP
jgi:uncharacterized flavoprotein (TIGR03862 family)